jgi:hypothetical protein
VRKTRRRFLNLDMAQACSFGKSPILTLPEWPRKQLPVKNFTYGGPWPRLETMSGKTIRTIKTFAMLVLLLAIGSGAALAQKKNALPKQAPLSQFIDKRRSCSARRA